MNTSKTNVYTTLDKRIGDSVDSKFLSLAETTCWLQMQLIPATGLYPTAMYGSYVLRRNNIHACRMEADYMKEFHSAFAKPVGIWRIKR